MVDAEWWFIRGGEKVRCYADGEECPNLVRNKWRPMHFGTARRFADETQMKSFVFALRGWDEMNPLRPCRSTAKQSFPLESAFPNPQFGTEVK
jgi:hypothetical protein